MAYNIGQPCKVSISRVKEHCSLTPYVNLVNQAIRRGNGFVILIAVHGNMAEIAGNAFDRFFGAVEVPFDSLIF